MRNTKRVLVDTSTLFSALGWTGAPFKVLVKIYEGNFTLVITDYILEELTAHINDYTGERRENAFQAIEYLRDAYIITEDRWVMNLESAEKLVGESKDAPIMAAYLLEEVDILVTSDLKDFPFEDFDEILTPNAFLRKY